MVVDVINEEFYNKYVEHFDKVPFGEVLTSLILKHLNKPNSQVLEIGSGAGALALWIQNLGHTIVCVEPAERPAEAARRKGLNVFNTTFQSFSSDKKFNCVLAISSLIHIPRLEIPLQIERITRLLKKEGVAIISFLEGSGEGYEDPTNTGQMRFFSKFSEYELKEILSPHFTIIEMQRIEVIKMKHSFLLFVLKL